MATSNVYLQISEQWSAMEAIRNAVEGSNTGGTKAKNSVGNIEVLEFKFTIEHELSAEEDGRSGVVERVNRTPLTVKKAADLYSPQLFEICCKGEMLSEAVLKVYGPRTDRPYLKYTMHNVRVCKYEPSGGEELATEEIGLNFAQMEVKFDNAGVGTAKNGNDRYGSIEYTWNWIANVPQYIPMPTEIPL